MSCAVTYEREVVGYCLMQLSMQQGRLLCPRLQTTPTSILGGDRGCVHACAQCCRR